jgi:hypothetical protein
MALIPMEYDDGIQNMALVEGTTFDNAFSKSLNQYTAFQVASAVADAPSQAYTNWRGLQWSNGSGNYGFQIALTYGTSIYIRSKVGGTWSAWRTI